MMFSSVRMLWFDQDQTLQDHAYASHRALQDLRNSDQRWQTIPEDEWIREYHRINEHMWSALLRERLSAWEDVRRRRFKLLMEHFGMPIEGIETISEWFLDLYVGHSRLLPGAMSTLQQLRERGWPVGIITDGSSSIQTRKLRQCGLDGLVDPLITPDDAGAFKPAPRIFAHGAEQVGIQASENLYVGDSWDNDVEGARAAGWQAVWLSDTAQSTQIGADGVVVVPKIEDVLMILPDSPPRQ